MHVAVGAAGHDVVAEPAERVGLHRVGMIDQLDVAADRVVRVALRRARRRWR